MNRQAGPSIVFSVLIVCFFAVVLFPGDQSRSTAPAPRGPIAGPIISRQPTTKPIPSTVPQSEQIVKSSPDSVAHPAAVARPVASGSAGKDASEDVVATTKATQPAQIPVDSARPSQGVPTNPVGTAPSMGRTESRSARQTAKERLVDPAGQAIRITSKESIRPDAHSWSLIHPEGSAERPGIARRPRNAFTVVAANETISDVAMRVYGTTDEVDGIWRANRDALPKRDSPLSPGTILSTPAPMHR